MVISKYTKTFLERVSAIRDHRIKTSDFFGHIRPCSFDLLTVTFQGQTFLENS